MSGLTDFQQIPVGVEEIEAVVITPVDRSVGRNATDLKNLLGGPEIGQADLEGVVALA